MPRKYTRKTETLEQQTHKELEKAWRAAAQPDGWPNGFKARSRCDDAFHESDARCAAWLNWLYGSPVAYSAVLQIWLEATVGGAPPGVFKNDIRKPQPGRGRPTNIDLARRAYLLYKPRKFGFTRVAKSMAIEYKQDPDQARQAARGRIDAYKKHRATHPITPLEDLAYRMLGLQDDGRLPEVEMPDDIRDLSEE